MDSDSETEQLIKAVEIRPFLHEKYKKVYIKKQAWESIASSIKGFEDATVAERRWNSLRGKYSTEMLRIKSEDPSLGHSSKWKYFDSLSFLKNHVNPRTSISQGYTSFRQNNSNSWSQIATGLNHSEATTTEQYYNNLLNLLSNNDEDSTDNSNGNDFMEKRAKIEEPPKVPQQHPKNTVAVKPDRTSAHIFGEFIGVFISEMPKDERLEVQMKIMQILMQHKVKSDQSK